MIARNLFSNINSKTNMPLIGYTSFCLHILQKFIYNKFLFVVYIILRL